MNCVTFDTAPRFNLDATIGCKSHNRSFVCAYPVSVSGSVSDNFAANFKFVHNRMIEVMRKDSKSFWYLSSILINLFCTTKKKAPVIR